MNTKNKTIWKFQLKTAYDTIQQMPKGAVILSCQMQESIICIWAMVDP